VFKFLNVIILLNKRDKRKWRFRYGEIMGFVEEERQIEGESFRFIYMK